jgi:hypothetical protein
MYGTTHDNNLPHQLLHAHANGQQPPIFMPQMHLMRPSGPWW